MVIDRFDNWLHFINGDIINVATEWNNMEYEDQKGISLFTCNWRFFFKYWKLIVC